MKREVNYSFDGRTGFVFQGFFGIFKDFRDFLGFFPKELFTPRKEVLDIMTLIISRFTSNK